MELLLILLDSIEFLGTPLFDPDDFWKLITIVCCPQWYDSFWPSQRSIT